MKNMKQEHKPGFFVDLKKSKENRGRPQTSNKLLHPIADNEIDLCADIDQQPINFAKWYHDSIMEITAVKLRLTPEVLQAIEDCKAQQEEILKLKIVDWKLASETYITI